MTRHYHPPLSAEAQIPNRKYVWPTRHRPLVMNTPATVKKYQRSEYEIVAETRWKGSSDLDYKASKWEIREKQVLLQTPKRVYRTRKISDKEMQKWWGVPGTRFRGRVCQNWERKKKGLVVRGWASKQLCIARNWKSGWTTSIRLRTGARCIAEKEAKLKFEMVKVRAHEQFR